MLQLENCLSDLSSPPACKRYRMKMEKRGLNLAVRDDNCTPHPGKVILVQHAQQGVHLIHSVRSQLNVIYFLIGSNIIHLLVISRVTCSLESAVTQVYVAKALPA